jgi:apolipoprotein N-acyltransferase
MTQARSGSTIPFKSVSLLVFASVLLQTLAADPFGQWYLAWIAIAPWLVAVGSAPTTRSAIRRAFCAGILYFAANLWWLWTASITGIVVLVIYFAAIQSIAAALIRGLGLLPSGVGRNEWRSVVNVFLIAIVWVAVEWFRCTIAVGFAWMPLGSTQTPIPLMCQVADLGGPWMVSFWVMLPNALIATIWMERAQTRAWRLPVAAVAGALVLVAIYGGWRIATTSTTIGPRVMVVQSDVRYLSGGVPAVDHQTSVPHLLDVLRKAVPAKQADLIVLPEGAFPPLNAEARRELARSPIGPSVERAYEELSQLSKEHETALLIGANAVTDWRTENGAHFGSEIRNSAYFFDPRGAELLSRYDKIQLVRFAERPALSGGPRWLMALAGYVSAARVAQPLVAGTWDGFRPFQLQWSETVHGSNAAKPQSAAPGKLAIAYFVSPICLENIDPVAVRRMVGDSPSGERKRAQFIANISNDGWFNSQEKYQHLQTIVLRCIENRVPMVRCSNTGISAFIDSCGRVQETFGTNVERSSVRRLGLDGRETLYMRYGDIFAIASMLIVAAAVIVFTVEQVIERRARNQAAPAKKR